MLPTCPIYSSQNSTLAETTASLSGSHKTVVGQQRLSGYSSPGRGQWVTTLTFRKVTNTLPNNTFAGRHQWVIQLILSAAASLSTQPKVQGKSSCVCSRRCRSGDPHFALQVLSDARDSGIDLAQFGLEHKHLLMHHFCGREEGRCTVRQPALTRDDNTLYQYGGLKPPCLFQPIFVSNHALAVYATNFPRDFFN